MSNNIFISYRRSDTAPWAGRLYDRLSQVFPADHIFLDVSGIEPGADFTKVLERQLSQCKVMLVLIGRHWLTARDTPGHRPLDDPRDYVRMEIEAALARNIRIVPVLVDGATMPTERDVPASLRGLTHRQAVDLTHARFVADAQTLVESLARAALAEGESEAAPALPMARAVGEPQADQRSLGFAITGVAACAGTALLFLIGLNSSVRVSGLPRKLVVGPVNDGVLADVPAAEIPIWHELGSGGVLAIIAATALVAALAAMVYYIKRERRAVALLLLLAAIAVAVPIVYASIGVLSCGAGYVFNGSFSWCARYSPLGL